MWISTKKYNGLITRIDRIEEVVSDKRGEIFSAWRMEEEMLREIMDNYLEHHTKVVLVKRDKEKIIGELKKIVTNNIFKEEK